ncbi:MAG: isopropylmalate isomerase small subunit, 3-isopropylmalate/(R)-2-methylmalate dehydratase small subunit [Candidatus Peregrinibacteria bacterium GW2011_GWF2_33_10]|nr:MAG: isopropylmalate isomerase small subunit, 3-isopropylmalate/(R)-2-methylmalate dehydratase small subunit [Candidatus Peregrinibacteria bacterium GW2011_GWF2_33_10]OGJ45085.1 MAG: 3-isopropylmalate dehydratase small subunit [Candidatus Peregrinibacteria bacterium RIFOXYA2_FULL_33_21]OGJ45491.1 MAG: 3-isopropylmalate dehydratase small subunit [Candidatus Peregrinibacteria bacterium RIFOXYA12_FULL_33_12]OGJ50750.1 MAG: 3-isopropylmalate dehydratase small subunit [Candidatus Peregrinibacteria
MLFLKSTCVPLRQNNVDTDQIIPARYLKAVSRDDVAEGLFYDWKYDEAGQLNKNFVLNNPEFEGARILIAQHNFGCGSSREHAPWALYDNGFRVILAISFADIFKNNCLKLGLLPIVLSEEIILKLLDSVEADPSLVVEIDLKNQQVRIAGLGGFAFSIDQFRKFCMMKNVDEIGYTLSFEDKIKDWEDKRIAVNGK